MDPGSSAQLMVIGAAQVTGGTGATTARTGDLAVAQTGAGVYIVDHVNSPGQGESILVDLSLVGNSGIASYAFTSATRITVSTFAVDGVTATNKSFSITVKQIPPTS